MQMFNIFREVHRRLQSGWWFNVHSTSSSEISSSHRRVSWTEFCFCIRDKFIFLLRTDSAESDVDNFTLSLIHVLIDSAESYPWLDIYSKQAAVKPNTSQIRNYFHKSRLYYPQHKKRGISNERQVLRKSIWYLEGKLTSTLYLTQIFS
jgi:hypothetical protein